MEDTDKTDTDQETDTDTDFDFDNNILVINDVEEVDDDADDTLDYNSDNEGTGIENENENENETENENENENEYTSAHSDEDLEIDKVSNISDTEEMPQDIIIGKNKTALPFLTKYEYTKLIGTRVAQLNSGAKPLIKINNSETNEQIAIEEINKNTIPFKIKRPLPNGTYEIFDISELQYFG